MTGTKFSDYLGIKHYKKGKNKAPIPSKNAIASFEKISIANKVIIEKSSGEGSLMEQDTIENVS